MKEFRLTCLVLLLAVSMFSFGACGGSKKEETETSEVKLETIGDVYAAAEEESVTYTMGEDRICCVFQADGVPYRVMADIPEGLYAKIDEISFEDEDRDKKVIELLSPVVLKEVTDLSDKIPDEKALSALQGKSGEELLNDGYEISGYYAADGEATFYLDKGLFEYEMTANEKVEDCDNFDGYEELPAMTVKTIEWAGFSSYASDFDVEF